MRFTNGYYKVENAYYNILEVNDDNVICYDSMDSYKLSIEYGDFGEAQADVKEKSGQERYNAKITSLWTEEMGESLKEMTEVLSGLCVILEGGERAFGKDGVGLNTFTKITEEEKIAIENDGDPLEAPPGPYTIQPDVPGKILWFSGAPGMGKSTTAQILARKNEFVYYEADCFGMLKNPYVPLDIENPSLSTLKQKSLKGPGAKERGAMLRETTDVFYKLMGGEEYDKDLLKKYYKEMGEDIKKEKARIGGSFAIAHVVLFKETRDLLREILGPDLIFVILDMSQEDRRKRVLKRHDGSEGAADLMDTFAKLSEPGQVAEPNTINLNVLGEMSKDDVVSEVLSCIKEIEDGQIKLLDGYYKVNNSIFESWKVTGVNIKPKDPHEIYDIPMTVAYGDFGEASEKITDVIGKCRYNAKFFYTWDMNHQDEQGNPVTIDMEDLAVIKEGGCRVYVKGMVEYDLEKITEEELADLENNFDDIEAPPGPYKIQPENQGEILWLSGAPGMGKSTSGQILAKKHGYVYYEADAFNLLKNPFNDLETDNPSMHQAKMKILKGPGDKERVALIKKSQEVWGPLMEGKEYDKDVILEYYTAMSHDILKQKERIGGNWAIAHVVFSKEARNVIREILGDKLTFIHLEMNGDERKKRLIGRHDQEFFVEMLQNFENIMEVDEGKPDFIRVNVTADMSRDSVVDLILETKTEKLQLSEPSLQNQMKLLDGYYKPIDSLMHFWKIDGERIEAEDFHNTYDFKPSFSYGDFGPASDQICEKIGKCNYNLLLNFDFAMRKADENGDLKPVEFHDYGVITDGGNKVYIKGFTHYEVDKISEEEFEELMNDFEDIEAPPGPYKIQPDIQGHILWISGAPGMGKSTSAQLLGKHHGYVYYEGDCFGSLKNPFNKIDSENPTMDQIKMKNLKGKGSSERAAFMKQCQDMWGPLMAGQEYDQGVMSEYFRMMGQDIATQKKRIGGNWAVATVVFNRADRDVLRQTLGEELTFVHLIMDSEEKRKRLEKRHSEGANTDTFLDIMENIEKLIDIKEDTEEPGLVVVKVSGEMSRVEIVEEILRRTEPKKEAHTIKKLNTDSKYCFM